MSADHEKKETGLRLIILYKLVKGSLMLVAAIALSAAIALGFEDALRGLASTLQAHVTRAWAVRIAEQIVEVSDRKHLVLAACALSFDGAITLTEGIGLQRGWRWAPWLVVIVTGSLLPFEIVSLVRAVRIGRVLVFAVNLAIVVYLARRTLREHRGGSARA
jgi:uncharacterized membrane protein (DUF2068 family)